MTPPAAIHLRPACQRLPLFALQAAPGTDLLADLEEREHQQEEEDEPLLCRFCLQPITNRGSALARNGFHLHTCSNPAGLIYTIGLFAEAPGCAVAGPLTLNYSWFSGYGWEIASCRNCFSHLGWRFRKGDSDLFFGLIIVHLVDGP